MMQSISPDWGTGSENWGRTIHMTKVVTNKVTAESQMEAGLYLQYCLILQCALFSILAARRRH